MKKLFLFLWLTVAALASEKPNIILIMVDDMGRDWVSCYGAKHPTPNIDQLAKQGVRYETCLLYTSPSPRDRQKSRMPSSA